MKGYCGQLKNNEILRTCASGGMATALYKKCLEEGGVCYGVAYTSDFYGVSYIRVSNEEELPLLKSSKYVKAPITKEIIEEVSKDLENGLKVVFVGLPCDLYDLTLFLEEKNINYENLLRVDLKCNGPVSMEAFSEYIKNLEKEKGSKVIRVITPFKNPSWFPVFIKVDFENGEEYEIKLGKTDFGVAFDYLKDEKCYYCAYKGDNHKSDMTISNFWGVNIKNPAFNIFGSSYAYVYTKKGEEALLALDDFNLFSDDAEKRVSRLPTHTTTPKKIKEYEKFKKNFSKYGLKKTVEKHKSFLSKLKRLFD